MVKITHPTMGRGDAVSASKTPTQDFVVEDATKKSPNTIDEHIKKFESTSVTAPEAQNKVDTLNRSNLESILFIGRLSKEIELHDHRFELSSMTNKEHNQMIKELYKFGDGADLFTIRILTLAHALKSIDGVSLDDMPVDGEFLNPYYKRMAVLDSMQLSVIQRLYEEYSKLIEDIDKAGDSEEIKK